MNIVAIIQARIGSTRLPNKVMKPLCGKPILWHVWNRLKHSEKIDNIVIATTTLPEDNLIQSFCEENKIDFYRGSSDDVLSRYYEAAKKYDSNTIVRITSDCPVIDPEITDKVIDLYTDNNFDYVSNCIERTFPRGFDTEVFSFSVLERTFNEATTKPEREHVTPYIYNHPDKFSIGSYKRNEDFSLHRWTVDTPEDFILIEIIYNSLYHDKEIFLLDDILKLFEEHPELIKINQAIEQKKLGE